jgi:UTP--glucose-1-phosphate uridylyltransferase
MLTLIDKPIIQYGVEEAVASGIGEIILVTSRGKSVMEDHFDVSSELEDLLAAKGKQALLDEVRKVSGLAKLSVVRQGRPLGLGHAVLMSRDLVGNEPFAVVLGDDIFHADPPALKQMVDVFDRAQGPVIAVERVPEADVSSYGILAVEPATEFGPRVHRILDMVEKPRREDAPSNLAIIGRYLLTPDIFPALEATASDTSGEIQLTNGMKRLLQSRRFYALEVDGVRHDAGNKLGFLKATAYFALQRPDLADDFTRYLTTLGFSRAPGDRER